MGLIFEWDENKATQNVKNIRCHLKKRAQYLLTRYPERYTIPSIPTTRIDMLS
jgi:hypothetical protein